MFGITGRVIFVLTFVFCHSFLIASQDVMQIPAEPGSYTWSVQLGAYASLASAEALKETVESQTAIPVTILNRDNIYRVRAGRLASGALARLLVNDLVETGFTKGFVCKEEIPQGKQKRFNDFDLYPFQVSLGLGFDCNPKLVANKLDGTAKVLSVLDGANRSSDVLTLYPAMRIDLASNLGIGQLEILDLSNEKDQWLSRLLNADRDVCSQATPTIPLKRYIDLAIDNSAPLSIRLAAMKAAADTDHYYMSKPGTSNSLESIRYYFALQHFAKAVGAKAYIQAAQIETAGVILEQARSKQGSFEDVRNLCSSIESNSSSTQRCFFTAKLMYSESYFFEGKYEAASAQLEELLDCEGLSLFPREKSMALFFAGLTYNRMRLYDKSLDRIEQVLRMQIPNDEQWRFKNHVWSMKLRALNLACTVCGRSGNDRYDYYYNKFQELHKEWGLNRAF